MKTNKLFLQTSFCVVLMLVVLSSCKKESSSPWNWDYLPVQMSKGASWSIIDKDGNEVVKEEYPADAEVSLIRDGVYWVKTNGKCQLFSIDSPKKPLTEEEFTTVTLFNAGVAVVSKPNEQIRIIDTNGKTVATLPKTIKKCWSFSKDGYAVFKDKDDKVGILNEKGSIVVPATYSDMIVNMNEGLTLAQKNKDDKKWLIINMKGEKKGEIDTDKYYALNNTFYEGKIMVRDINNEDGPTIVLDNTGKKLFEIRKERAKYGCPEYFDGYHAFINADNKCGVVNDKGEEVIRPKYDGIRNLGKGEFAAKKGDKWGIINEKDETILDFDYEEGCVKMGDNYMIQDASGWVLVGKDKKEITSCDKIEVGAVSNYAEYVDIDGLANQFIKQIEEFETAPSAEEIASQTGINIDSKHYEYKLDRSYDIDSKLSSGVTFWYHSYVAHEKTHQEEVNDGWFTYNRTVSDGWNWSPERAYYVVGTWSFSDSGFDCDAFLSTVVEKLLQTHKKLSNGEYSKIVTVGGEKKEARVAITPRGSSFTLSVEFKK